MSGPWPLATTRWSSASSARSRCPSAGEPLEVGAGKQRALLALLLLSAGEVVSTDRLIDALWEERPPASALNSVHVYVSQLRKALRERAPGDARARVPARARARSSSTSAGSSACSPRVESSSPRARPERAAEALRSALALWRGPPLSDFASEPFAQGEIARLEELRLAALEERIEADLALGRHAELVSELEALVREHPLRERLRAQLMLALYRSGRQAEALAAYQQARRMLAEELGLEPGRALQELEACDPETGRAARSARATCRPTPPSSPQKRRPDRDRRRPAPVGGDGRRRHRAHRRRQPRD